jgi:hypothetical protein
VNHKATAHWANGRTNQTACTVSAIESQSRKTGERMGCCREWGRIPRVVLGWCLRG